MKTSRLEAFSDGVLAIIITIMVLEFKVPEETNYHTILDMAPEFLSYLFSFIYIGISWNNHHHIFQISERVNGKILWANLHLLFWLSLIPFATSWVGEHHNSYIPFAIYGFVLLMISIAFNILVVSIINVHERDFPLKKFLGRKNKLSILLYIIGIGLSFFTIIGAIICYIIVALMWLIPEKRIENIIE